MRFDTKIMTDETIFEQEAIRILRRLCEKGVVLAAATGMDKAVVCVTVPMVRALEQRWLNTLLRKLWR